MANDAPRVVVLSASHDFVRVVRSANHDLHNPAQIVFVEPTDTDIGFRLGQADLVLANLDVLPLASLPRRRLYGILRRKPALFFYPAGESPTYERTREAYRSGARDLLPQPSRATQVAHYLAEFLPHRARPLHTLH